MTMIVKDGFLVCGRRPCVACMGDGTLPVQHTCEKCKGFGEMVTNTEWPFNDEPSCDFVVCSECFGSGRVYGPDQEDCGRCHNEDPFTHDQATLYDTPPKEIWDSLEFRVFYNNEARAYEEKFAGRNYVVSVIDNGAHKSWLVNELIAHVVRSLYFTQSVKVARPVNKDATRGKLCEYVAIIRHSWGYNVQAVWQEVRA